MPGARPDTTASQLAYQRALVSEARMLIDYLASLPDRSLSGLKAKECPGTPATNAPASDIDACRILALVDGYARTVDSGDGTLSAEQCSTLQLIRDALVTAVRPATGLTVAYTAMVVGNRRGAGSQSRASLAQGAYPGLRGAAIWQRYWHMLLIGLALLVTLTAAWEATKVALGKNLMHRLESLRVEQQAIDTDKAGVERAEAADQGAGAIPLAGFSVDAAARARVRGFGLCDRPVASAWALLAVRRTGEIPSNPPIAEGALGRALVLAMPALATLTGEKLKLYASPDERDVCERDHVLAINFGIVHADLARYEQDWPQMAGAYYRETSWLMDRIGRQIWGRAAYERLRWQPAPGQDDVEIMIAPELVVWGNYVLPVIFGLLGALIYVILDLYGRMRESRLEPRDFLLSVTRLVLGLVTGACVGLFFSTYGPNNPAPGADLIEALTLSASGLAFLAGFGVEGVFTLLQNLIGRVFLAAK